MSSVPSIGHITFDCEDPHTVARFWASVLSLEIENDWGEFVRLSEGQGGIKLAFVKVPESKQVKNRVHLDISTEDRESEITRLEALGASQLKTHETQGFTWTVMADVEGNEFCVSE
jgi:predicted enzyme related to lactoylglutathione lyase